MDLRTVSFIIDNVAIICPADKQSTVVLTPLLLKCLEGFFKRVAQNGNETNVDSSLQHLASVVNVLGRPYISTLLSGLVRGKSKPVTSFSDYCSLWKQDRVVISVCWDFVDILHMLVVDKVELAFGDTAASRHVSFLPGLLPFLWSLLLCGSSFSEKVDGGVKVGRQYILYFQELLVETQTA